MYRLSSVCNTGEENKRLFFYWLAKYGLIKPNNNVLRERNIFRWLRPVRSYQQYVFDDSIPPTKTHNERFHKHVYTRNLTHLAWTLFDAIGYEIQQPSRRETSQRWEKCSNWPNMNFNEMPKTVRMRISGAVKRTVTYASANFSVLGRTLDVSIIIFKSSPRA